MLAGMPGLSAIGARRYRIFERALTDPTMQGAYIASSPNPVSQRVFMRELRRAMRIPVGLPASTWMVRLGVPLFLRTDPELALYGRYVVPKRLQDQGFEFRFPDLGPALRDLLGCREKEKYGGTNRSRHVSCASSTLIAPLANDC